MVGILISSLNVMTSTELLISVYDRLYYDGIYYDSIYYDYI